MGIEPRIFTPETLYVKNKAATLGFLTRDDDILDVFVGVVGHAHVHVYGFAMVEGLQERRGQRFRHDGVYTTITITNIVSYKGTR